MKQKTLIMHALGISLLMAACSPSVAVNVDSTKGETAAAPVPASTEKASLAVNNAVETTAPLVADTVASISDAAAAIDTDQLKTTVTVTKTAISNLTGGSQ